MWIKYKSAAENLDLSNADRIFVKDKQVIITNKGEAVRTFLTKSNKMAYEAFNKIIEAVEKGLNFVNLDEEPAEKTQSQIAPSAIERSLEQRRVKELLKKKNERENFIREIGSLICTRIGNDTCDCCGNKDIIPECHLCRNQISWTISPTKALQIAVEITGKYGLPSRQETDIAHAIMKATGYSDCRNCEHDPNDSGDEKNFCTKCIEEGSTGWRLSSVTARKIAEKIPDIIGIC